MISIITPTHNPQFLFETWASLRRQTTKVPWEWVVVANGDATVGSVHRALGGDHDDPRIKISSCSVTPERSIGAIKREAFSRGAGDILVELDHDDTLSSDALDEIASAFRDPVDFVYSNSADVLPDGSSSRYNNWEGSGWRYREADVGGQRIDASVAFAPSAASCSLILYAPNHVRAWRRSFYEKIGRHNAGFSVCDDAELLIRTYLHGRMKHIDKCLYVYRMGPHNTFTPLAPQIEAISYQLALQNMEALCLREGELRGLPCYDLGGAIGCPPGWLAVDLEAPTHVRCDLTGRWPFADSSVMAFRCADIIEHLPDKQHTMRELHRCLVPGGWALITVPSTDGRGAFQDPTHVSFWNANSFWYWTRRQTAAYIRNREVMFMPRWIDTTEPSDWHKQHKISYVTAHLQAFKGDMTGIPGVRP